MPKVPSTYLENRRLQILGAAAACFAQGGFHQTTMQDICRESELSPGAVYRYFRSKEEIIEAICAQRQEANAGSIATAMAAGNTLEVLDELIRLFFTEVDPTDQQTTCALLVEMFSEAPRSEQIRTLLQRSGAAAREPFIEIVRQSQARGEFNPNLDPEAIARVMVALYHGFITQKLVDSDFDTGTYADAVRALFGGSFWVGPKPDAAHPA